MADTRFSGEAVGILYLWMCMWDESSCSLPVRPGKRGSMFFKHMFVVSGSGRPGQSNTHILYYQISLWTATYFLILLLFPVTDTGVCKYWPCCFLHVHFPGLVGGGCFRTEPEPVSLFVCVRNSAPVFKNNERHSNHQGLLMAHHTGQCRRSGRAALVPFCCQPCTMARREQPG